jgi:hypothetical protein
LESLAIIVTPYHVQNSSNDGNVRDKYRGVQTYIIHDEEGGLIKIGKSIRPEERIRNISTISGRSVRVLAIINGNFEGELHKMFSDIRVFGEWFKDDARIHEHVKKMLHEQGAGGAA